MLQGVFLQVLTLSLGGGIVALMLLVIRALLWRRLPAKVQYGLWSILLLRLILPVAPQSPLSLLAFAPRGGSAQSAQPLAQVSSAMPVTQTAPASQAHAVVSAAQLSGSAAGFHPGFNLETAAFLWLAVTAAILAYIVAVNLVAVFRLRFCVPCSEAKVIDAMECCRKKLHMHGSTEAVYSAKVKAPAVFGLFKPKILLPPLWPRLWRATGLDILFCMK
jgi:bla regulator protein BlaR1